MNTCSKYSHLSSGRKAGIISLTACDWRVSRVGRNTEKKLDYIAYVLFAAFQTELIKPNKLDQVEFVNFSTPNLSLALVFCFHLHVLFFRNQLRMTSRLHVYVFFIGDTVQMGKYNVFRFNNPLEAARLREEYKVRTSYLSH